MKVASGSNERHNPHHAPPRAHNSPSGANPAGISPHGRKLAVREVSNTAAGYPAADPDIESKTMKFAFVGPLGNIGGFIRADIFWKDHDGVVIGPFEWLFDPRNSISITEEKP